MQIEGNFFQEVPEALPIVREGYQAPSPEVVCTAIPHSTITVPMRAKECVQCVPSVQWLLQAWSAVGDIFIILVSLSAWSYYNEINIKHRNKRRFNKHFCETENCFCYQCSICSRCLVFKGAFVKHHQFSEWVLWVVGVFLWGEKKRKKIVAIFQSIIHNN